MLKASLFAMIAISAMAQDPDQIYSVIRENNLTQLKALLGRNSAAVDDSRGITPLMYAAEVGSLDAMRLLIDRGADVNAQNAFGSTALMWSVSDPAKVRLLLDHGAQVNTAAKSGRTALIVAAFTNPSAEIVRLLLAKGAKVDVMDQRHVTPLNAATFGNDTATVRLLLDAGTDLGASIDTPDTFIGLTPLMNAAGNRNVEVVKLLIAKGAKVNAVSKTEGLPKIQTGTVEFGGWTPLLMSSAFGPPEAVKALLDAGAKVDAQDYRGFTPLMLAVGTDRYDRRTVNLVLSHGADLRPTNHAGETALDWANKFADPEVIRSLGGTPKNLATPVQLSDQLPDTRTAIARSMHLLESTTDQFFKRAGASPAMSSLRRSLPQPPRAQRVFRWMRKRRTNAFCKSLRPLTPSRSKAQPRWAARITTYTRSKPWCAAATRPIALRIFSPRTWRHRKAVTADGTSRVIRDPLCRTATFHERQWPSGR